MENKRNDNKISFRVKEQAKLSSDDIADNTPPSPNTPTEAQVTDLSEGSITEDSNSNHTS